MPASPSSWRDRIFAVLATVLLLSFAHAALRAEDSLFLLGSWQPNNPALPSTVAPGASVTLSALFLPSTPGSYQWLRDGQPIPGATGTTYHLARATPADTGNYQLRFTHDGDVRFTRNTEPLNVIPLPPSPVDTSFTAALPPGFSNADVLATPADGGAVVIASKSDVAEGPSTPVQISRLNRDGSLAHTFTIGQGGRGSVLTAFPDGSVIIASYPYRKDPDGHDVPLTLPVGFDSTQPLAAAAVQPDGKFLIAQDKHLARLNADGSIDPHFAYTGAFSSTTGVLKFVFDAQGRIYAHGVQVSRDIISGQMSIETWVAFRLMGDGSQDSQFVPQYQSGGHVAYSDTVVLHPLGDGRILRTGDVPNVYRPDWAMLHDDGTVDPRWSAPSGITPYFSVLVDPAHLRLFHTEENTNVIRRVTITDTGLTEDNDFYPGDGQPYPGNYDGKGLYLTADSDLLVTSLGTAWDGHTSAGLFRLRSSDHSVVPPAVEIAPKDYNDMPSRGATVVLTSTVRGTGSLTYRWLALDGQPLPAVSTSNQLVLSAFDVANLGRYQLRVTNAQGTPVISNIVQLTLSRFPFLANLSGRAQSGTGEDTVLAGLVSDSYSRGPLVRSAGPALRSLGVVHFLPDPALKIFNASGTLVGGNDNWSADSNTADHVAALATSAGAFAFAPGSLDAALDANLLNSFGGARVHTVQLSDSSGASGIGLLEIYSDPAVGSSLVNLSFRARTAPGEATAIAGFVIVDPQGFNRSVKLLLRAVGPTLSTQGVLHPLENPVLTVYDSAGKLVTQNDDWSLSSVSNPTAAADLAAAMKQVGAFDLPAASKDAALLLDLPAGAYTMHATGGTGVVLLEIYLVR